ncbi:hypothetical protein GCM10010260_48050 [Streptomyces filipinensis]|uniref:Uncharacterized protein n=1 Tax=Streptomyces filipinensis TaxID=66887 RepID=A0A918IET6_9ACTN|nr:hypothetical protein [Streptomyces filipinensis]GGV05293.1 hypothetical protein GCM10010260_48050 [Streptomyces filipinensis]
MRRLTGTYRRGSSFGKLGVSASEETNRRVPAVPACPNGAV